MKYKGAIKGYERELEDVVNPELLRSFVKSEC